MISDFGVRDLEVADLGVRDLRVSDSQLEIKRLEIHVFLNFGVIDLGDKYLEVRDLGLVI